MNGALETATQNRHLLISLSDIHRKQRTTLACSPGQRLGLIIEIQPVQPGDMHLGIDAGVFQQLPRKTRIEILRPMRQRRHRRAVAPGVERRNDTAAGPGGFAADTGGLDQHHRDASARQQQASQQTNSTAPNHNHAFHPIDSTLARLIAAVYTF